MRTVLIVGSGPAAAGAALALLEDPEVSVTIIDLGLRLEEENDEARARLATEDEGAWAADDLAVVQHQPVAVGGGRLPQK
ncbi:MAG: 4Fe-4S ferredoxin, partial [Verrucomicrobiota bacterium]